MNVRALVIGDNISGMQAVVNMATRGYEVVPVEQEPSISGHMAQLSEMSPTLDCSKCMLMSRMVMWDALQVPTASR